MLSVEDDRARLGLFVWSRSHMEQWTKTPWFSFSVDFYLFGTIRFLLLLTPKYLSDGWQYRTHMNWFVIYIQCIQYMHRVYKTYFRHYCVGRLSFCVENKHGDEWSPFLWVQGCLGWTIKHLKHLDLWNSLPSFILSTLDIWRQILLDIIIVYHIVYCFVRFVCFMEFLLPLVQS